jgi:phosphonopyruvate decarboxylase
MDRDTALHIIISQLKQKDILITSTGLIGRSALKLFEDERHFYMAGSLGLSSSIGFGLAISKPKLKVWIVEGDGSLLLNLGSLATVGSTKPSNLVHIVLDNKMYESSGKIPSYTNKIDLCKIAKSCGYEFVRSAKNRKNLINILKEVKKKRKLSFIKVNITANIKAKKEELPRPKNLSTIAKKFKIYICNNINIY